MICYRGHDSERFANGSCKQCALEYNRARRSPNGGRLLRFDDSYDVINAVRCVLGLDELETTR